jgi:uncharacterized lipoprotein
MKKISFVIASIFLLTLAGCESFENHNGTDRDGPNHSSSG